MRKQLKIMAVLVISALFALSEAALAEKPAPAKEGEQCGTIQGISCDKGLWCDLREGACKGKDLDGICVKPGDVCTENYTPVCGCNGKTYANDCKRIQAKKQKNHAGECISSKNQTRPSQTKPSE